MEEAEGRNQTPIAEFILLGFGNNPELQPLLILVFLVIYVVTVAGNTLIVVLVVADQHLHTPMYFFLGNLSCLETCYSSNLLLPLLFRLLTGDRTISIRGCLVQLYFFGILSTSETLLLTAMSCDRYLAICQPLRYTALMNARVWGQLMAGSWVGGCLIPTLANIFLFQLKFCGSKEIDHFFCDLSPVINLSCGDTRTQELVTFALTSIGTFVPCLVTLSSYVCIIATILRIPSTTGRHKAFSTCSSHLIVITVFYFTMVFIYVFPTANMSTVLHKIFSVFYTVLTPLINPVIYCLRNKEVQESLRRALLKLGIFKSSYGS